MKNKVDRDFNFAPFKSFDIKDIKIRVEKFSQEWDVDTSRQSTVYEGRPNPHVNTNTYIIQNSSLHWERRQSQPATQKFGQISNPFEAIDRT